MKFSIIVPVYNVRDQLPRAVESLFKQTFTDWEAVLVDDGSVDGSSHLCDKLAETDARIKVIHQANAGVVVARMRGFDVSTGSWVLFLDGDDALKVDCLHDIARSVEKEPCEIVQFGYDLEFQNGVIDEKRPIVTGMKPFDWILEHMAKTPLDILEMCIGNKCYRREIAKAAFNDVGDVRISHSEDGLFAFAAFLHSDKINFIGNTYYRYILRGTSAVHRVNLKIVAEKQQFIDRMELLAKRSGRLSDETIKRMIEFHAYQACCYVFLMLKRNRASRQDVKHVLSSIVESKFYRMPNREWNSMKRRIMHFLLAHHRIYLLACFLWAVNK